MDAESPAHGVSTDTDVAEAALAGWLQSDGFVGQYGGRTAALTIQAMTVTPAELEWVLSAIDAVFPGVPPRANGRTQDVSPDCRRTRLYGDGLERLRGADGDCAPGAPP